MAYMPILDQAGPSARCRPVYRRRITSCPIKRPPKDRSMLSTSGSGENTGAAPGPKSRGGSGMTERGVPSSGLVWGWARAGTGAAAPTSIRRRSRLATEFLPLFCCRRASKPCATLSTTSHRMDRREAAHNQAPDIEGHVISHLHARVLVHLLFRRIQEFAAGPDLPGG